MHKKVLHSTEIDGEISEAAAEINEEVAVSRKVEAQILVRYGSSS
jgi:hypothetical protein